MDVFVDGYLILTEAPLDFVNHYHYYYPPLEGLNTLGVCISLLWLLLLSTLGRCASPFATLGRVAVLVVAHLVGCNKSDNIPIALLILLSLNGISQFYFAFIAAVNSSSAVVAWSAATFCGNSNFDGMNTYISVCLSSLVDGR